jgi:hypothetical protein
MLRLISLSTIIKQAETNHFQIDPICLNVFMFDKSFVAIGRVRAIRKKKHDSFYLKSDSLFIYPQNDTYDELARKMFECDRYDPNGIHFEF